MQYAYYLELPLVFPEGIHFGAGSQFNQLAIARDGLGRPVWNGSSIAGWLRAIWKDHLLIHNRDASTPSLAIFGRALGTNADTMDDWLESGIESCVKATNCLLETGVNAPPKERIICETVIEAPSSNVVCLESNRAPRHDDQVSDLGPRSRRSRHRDY